MPTWASFRLPSYTLTRVHCLKEISLFLLLLSSSQWQIFHEKDTVHVVKEYSVLQATLITDLIQQFVKCPLLPGPTKLKKDYEMAEKYVIASA